MPQSNIPVGYEQQLMWACFAGNKLNRIFTGTTMDSLIANATDVDDYISDVYGNLRVSGTSTEKFPPDTRNLVRYFEQGIRTLQVIGRLTTALLTSATDWDTASADTSLRYLFSQYVTQNGFDVTAEPFFDAVFGQATSA